MGTLPWGLEYDGWLVHQRPGLVMNAPSPLRIQVLPCRLRHRSHFLGTLGGLESPATEGCVLGGEIGEPRRLWRSCSRAQGRLGPPRSREGNWQGKQCGTSTSVLRVPTVFRSSWLAEISSGPLFLFLAAAGSCSHICSCSSCCGAPSSLLFSLLPLALLPAMYTLNSSTDTRAHCLLSSLPGPLVSR